MLIKNNPSLYPFNMFNVVATFKPLWKKLDLVIDSLNTANHMENQSSPFDQSDFRIYSRYGTP